MDRSVVVSRVNLRCCTRVDKSEAGAAITVDLMMEEASRSALAEVAQWKMSVVRFLLILSKKIVVFCSLSSCRNKELENCLV